MIVILDTARATLLIVSHSSNSARASRTSRKTSYSPEIQVQKYRRAGSEPSPSRVKHSRRNVNRASIRAQPGRNLKRKLQAKLAERGLWVRNHFNNTMPRPRRNPSRPVFFSSLKSTYFSSTTHTVVGKPGVDYRSQPCIRLDRRQSAAPGAAVKAKVVCIAISCSFNPLSNKSLQNSYGNCGDTRGDTIRLHHAFSRNGTT